MAKSDINQVERPPVVLWTLMDNFRLYSLDIDPVARSILQMLVPLTKKCCSFRNAPVCTSFQPQNANAPMLRLWQSHRSILNSFQLAHSICIVDTCPNTFRCVRLTPDVCAQVQLAKDPVDARPPLEDKGFADLLSNIRGMVHSDEEAYSHYLAKEKIVCLHMKRVLTEIGDSKDSCGSRVLKVHRSSLFLRVQLPCKRNVGGELPRGVVELWCA